jgi:cobalamin biosynthesis Co2+ chelatase CbiK
MINLYKEVNGKEELVDFGFSSNEESYEKQGYEVGGYADGCGTTVEFKNDFIIHHIHRARFNLRGRINNLICKLIPERFLNY